MVQLRIALEQPSNPSGSQKVFLDDQNLVNWYGTTDESIRVNNGNTPIQVHNNTANVGESNTYTAVYPYQNSLGDVNTANNGSVTVTIPAVQTFERGADGRQNLKDLPMGAYLTAAKAADVPVLMFRNLASLIKVTVENPSSQHPFRVNSIKLTGSVPLHGKYTWIFNQSTNDYSPAMYTSYTSPTYGKEVLLDLNGCANPNDQNDLSKYTFDTIGPDGSKTYYIVVAPFTTASTSFKVEMRGAVLGNYWIDGPAGNYPGEAIKIYTKSFTGLNVTLDRSRIGTIPVHSTDYTVSGGFSVASSDVRYFSPGNLSKDYKDNDYVFIHDQFATVGAYNNHMIYIHNTKADIDLFPSSAINDLNNNFVFTYWPNSQPYYEPAGTWKCPKKSDINYVLFLRGSSDTKRYDKINIEGKNGLILFPDGFTLPNWVSFTNVNQSGVGFTDGITKIQWKLLEASGAIFLPTTGQMYAANGSTGYYEGGITSYGERASDNQDNKIGFYWMRDRNTNTNSLQNLYFQHVIIPVGEPNAGTHSAVGFRDVSSAFYQSIRPMRQ